MLNKLIAIYGRIIELTDICDVNESEFSTNDWKSKKYRQIVEKYLRAYK
jgi:hypothetical protein